MYSVDVVRKISKNLSGRGPPPSSSSSCVPQVSADACSRWLSLGYPSTLCGSNADVEQDASSKYSDFGMPTKRGSTHSLSIEHLSSHKTV